MNAYEEPAARDQRRLNREEIRTRLTQQLALFLLVAAIPAWWATLGDVASLWATFASLVSLSVVSLVTLILVGRRPRTARLLLVIVPSLALALSAWQTPHPTLTLWAILIVVGGGAVDPFLGILAAGLVSMSLLLFPSDHHPYGLMAVWLAAAVQWLSGHGLFMALDWAWNAQLRSDRLLAELRDRRGELNRTLTALTEATRRLERTNRELAVARQQADEARALKEQFVANVSHELRTPLNLIVGFAEMMYLVPETYEGVVWAPTLVADIGRMYRASRHLQDLVNDILDLSRIDAARLPMFRELSDVRAIVQDAVATVNPLFEQKGLTLTIECAADLPKLFVDRTRIRQAILNLLNNAVRFTDQGGITIRVERSDEAVLLHVSDTGVGIPQDQLERIFEQFTQVEIGSRSRGGAGLGLAISRQFVELHGGRMWAESETGKGSTFSVSLPLPGVVAPQLLRRLPGRTTVDFSRAPVVVVDPDPGIADMLSRYLGDRPVLAARDLAESERVVHAEHPLAVIVNCVPETPPASWVGPSGPLSERYNVPVLRCSIPSPSWLSQSTGLDECLTKPIAREMLGEVLERYCGAAGKVAIVDDEAGFVSLITRMIETLPGDYEVVTAYSGAEAIRLVEEQRPALMLLDLLMPEMSGFDVLDVLRANRDLEHLRVVAVTATSYAEDILTRQGGYLTVTQPNGYSAGAVADFLNLALQIFRPDYVGDARNAYSA